jgi:hypothetical protein
VIRLVNVRMLRRNWYGAHCDTEKTGRTVHNEMNGICRDIAPAQGNTLQYRDS